MEQEKGQHDTEDMTQYSNWDKGQQDKGVYIM